MKVKMAKEREMQSGSWGSDDKKTMNIITVSFTSFSKR
jgi:hypothetical protein